MQRRDQISHSPAKRIYMILKNFKSDVGGNVIILFALMSPVIFMIAGFSLDLGLALVQKKRLQTAVDAGAIAAAKEFTLVNSEEEQLKIIASSAVKANLQGKGPTPQITVSASTENLTVTLAAFQEVKTFFGGVYGDKIKRITASAEAVVVGSTRICVLALDTNTTGAVSAETQAKLTGNGCAVFSNSTSSSSVVAKNSAQVNASLVCASGGISGEDKINPTPLSDCPSTPDPLVDRPAPPIGACQENWLMIDVDTTLSPGTYCGGLQVYSGARVFLQPGVYIIKDGPLIVSGNAKLDGENVGFYLTGSKAKIKFTSDSSISLTAPKDGPLAGLLMFEDNNRKTAATHYFQSDDARLMLGTIYLPASNMVVDANSPVADQSAYTAIIVKTLKLYNGPHLILNTDYNATDIPVPEGIKGVGNTVTLAR